MTASSLSNEHSQTHSFVSLFTVQLNKLKLFHFLSIHRQVIPLVILEEGSYEKDVLLYVNIGEPNMVGGKFNIVMQ